MRMLEIIVAVFIGSFLSSVAYEQFTLARAEHAAKKALQQIQREDLARREAQARQARDKALAEDAQRQAVAERQAQAMAERRRREDAWNRFFKPLPQCRDNSAQTECANHHIREKRRFDVMYDAGQI